MAEYRSFENDKVRDLVLQYADPKYTHVVMKINDSSMCPDEIWCLEEGNEEAIKRVETETAGYANDPEFQFYACKIIKSGFSTYLERV